MLTTGQNRNVFTQTVQTAAAFVGLTLGLGEFSASGAGVVTVGHTNVTPTLSIVDYLKAKKEPSELADRKKRYNELFAGEPYSGTAPQNIKLLATLTAQDQACKVTLDKCEANLKKKAVPAPPASTKLLSQFVRCPSYVLAENFGINGSYVYNLSIARTGDKIVDRQVQVALNSTASNLGTLSFSGSVEISAGGKVIQSFLLQKAWFDTVGPSDDTTVYMYGAKGTVVNLPANQEIFAKVKVTPIVKTVEGIVPLWSCAVDAKLP